MAHRMHASNRTDLRQSRSTIVPVSRPASDTSPGETLLATCNPVFTYFQTPVSTPDRGPTVCTPVFVSSSAKFLARVLNRVSVGNYYERKRKSFGDAKCYVSTMNTFYSNLERGMLRIAIFRNVSSFFFFFFFILTMPREKWKKFTAKRLISITISSRKVNLDTTVL